MIGVGATTIGEEGDGRIRRYDVVQDYTWQLAGMFSLHSA